MADPVRLLNNFESGAFYGSEAAAESLSQQGTKLQSDLLCTQALQNGPTSDSETSASDSETPRPSDSETCSPSDSETSASDSGNFQALGFGNSLPPGFGNFQALGFGNFDALGFRKLAFPPGFGNFSVGFGNFQALGFGNMPFPPDSETSTSDSETSRPSDSETRCPPDSETSRPSDSETSRPLDSETCLSPRIRETSTSDSKTSIVTRTLWKGGICIQEYHCMWVLGGKFRKWLAIVTRTLSKGGICIEEYHCMSGFGGEVLKMTSHRDKNSIKGRDWHWGIPLHVGLWGGSLRKDLQSWQELFERQGFALRTDIACKVFGGEV